MREIRDDRLGSRKVLSLTEQLDTFKKKQKKKRTVDWKAVDQRRIDMLPKLLADRDLVILQQDYNAEGCRV